MHQHTVTPPSINLYEIGLYHRASNVSNTLSLADGHRRSICIHCKHKHKCCVGKVHLVVVAWVRVALVQSYRISLEHWDRVQDTLPENSGKSRMSHSSSCRYRAQGLGRMTTCFAVGVSRIVRWSSGIAFGCCAWI